MFAFLRKLFGGSATNDPGDGTAPQDRRAAEELARAGLQVPPTPAPPKHDPRTGEYDRRPRDPATPPRPPPIPPKPS